jgi:hypothetical protein
VADREAAFRELEERVLEAVAEYQRVLYHEFVAAREEVSWRYRYAEAARRDLEDASARASELRERMKGFQEETNVQNQADALAAADLGWSTPPRRRIWLAPRGWRGPLKPSSLGRSLPSETTPSTKSVFLNSHAKP